MSKSNGNFFTPRDLIKPGSDYAPLRLELIKTHYRSNANFTEQGSIDSVEYVDKLRNYAREIEYALDESQSGRPAAYDVSQYIEKITDSLNNDLNIAEALGQLSVATGYFRHFPMSGSASERVAYGSWRSRARSIRLPTHPMSNKDAYALYTNGTGFSRALGAIHLIDNILGIIFTPFANKKLGETTQTEIGVFLDGIMPSVEIEAQLARRAEARKAKDFATSDAIRDELSALGYAIKDVAGGKVEVSRK